MSESGSFLGQKIKRMPPIFSKFHIFWQFSRPHTIIGTTVSLLGLYVITLSEANSYILKPDVFLLAIISCLAGNVYIVGLNQLTDIEIDRVNKPELPLPSGNMSVGTGRITVILCGILSIGVAVFQGFYLFLVVAISLFLGTIYSLPPVRLKRFPFWAAFSIFTVRGFVINLGIYLHFSRQLLGNTKIPPEIWALTLFIFGFSLIIAWFKDIPDTEGDRQFKIITFAIRLGKTTVFYMGLVILTLFYTGLMAAGWIVLTEVNNWFLTLTHGILLVSLLWRSYLVNAHRKQDMVQHYYFIWKLFYLEYLVFPAAYVLA